MKYALIIPIFMTYIHEKIKKMATESLNLLKFIYVSINLFVYLLDLTNA